MIPQVAPHCDQSHFAEIDMSKLSFNHKELLGSGTFAKVFRGTYHGSLVAVKIFNHFNSNPHVKLDETMRSESIIMKYAINFWLTNLQNDVTYKCSEMDRRKLGRTSHTS